MKNFLHAIARFTGWYSTWLSTRVLIILGIITSGLLGGLLYLAGVGFKQDKLAYIYDFQDVQNEGLVTRIESGIREMTRTGEFAEITNSVEVLQQYRIPRLPVGREMFLASFRDAPLLLWRDDDYKLRKKQLPNDAIKDFFERKDGKAYVASSFGVFFGSSYLSDVTKDNFTSRAAVREFSKSKLVNGLVTLNEGEDEIIASFREIPDTNLVIFNERSLAEALAPFNRFLYGSLLLGSGVILLGIFLTRFMLSTIWRPVTRAANITQQIASGTYDVDSTYHFRDELRVIFDGLGAMASRLKSREQSLLKFQKNLEQILSTTLEMALAEDKLRIVNSAVQSILRTVGLRENSSAIVTFFPDFEDATVSDKVFLIAENGLILKTPRAIENEVDAKEVQKAEGSFVTPAAKPASYLNKSRLEVPIVSGSKYLAKVSLDSYANEALAPMDRVFIDTLAASMAVAFENLFLRESAAEKTRLESQLQTAQAVQANLLPQQDFIPGIEVAEFYKSSEQTGGDWLGRHYDKQNNTVYFYIGDVTGHGVASALLTGVACGAVYASEFTTEDHELNSFGRSLDPSVRLSILAQVLNRVMTQTGKGNLLMTMAIFSLNLSTGAVAYVSAGHTPLFHIKFADKKFEVIPNGGSILGLSNDANFTVKETKLSPGDALLLYTDGLVENQGPAGETLKLKKVLRNLSTNPNSSASELLELVMTEAESKWQGTPGNDDVSVLLLKWAESMPRQHPENLPIANATGVA